MAYTPRMSLCMASRFRSRQTIWKLGSMPSEIKMVLAAQLAILTTAVWLSVMLTASTMPFRCAIFSLRCATLAPLGGPHSPVKAK